MRDPELMMRAQQAAAELERAWDRWRTMHGLGIDPPPPVSSYVGYSLEEPWGRPRVVFGIDAREAEQLVALLDRHDCAGPVYASVASMAAARAGEAADARAAEADWHRGAGHVRVPTQAQPGAMQRERLPEPAQPEALRGPLEPPRRDNGPRAEEPGARPAGPQAQEPLSVDQEAPARGDDQDPEAMQPGPPAFRPQLEPTAYLDEDSEPGQAEDQPGHAAEPGRASAGWTRAGRVPGGHAQSRQKRAARGGSTRQEGRERSGVDAMAAELAGWTAGELPGQASRC
jgi:hypothetical protein